jgi:hypothetical protein
MRLCRPRWPRARGRRRLYGTRKPHDAATIPCRIPRSGPWWTGWQPRLGSDVTACEQKVQRTCLCYRKQGTTELLGNDAVRRIDSVGWAVCAIIPAVQVVTRRAYRLSRCCRSCGFALLRCIRYNRFLVGLCGGAIYSVGANTGATAKRECSFVQMGRQVVVRTNEVNSGARMEKGPLTIDNSFVGRNNAIMQLRLILSCPKRVRCC